MDVWLPVMVLVCDPLISEILLPSVVWVWLPITFEITFPALKLTRELPVPTVNVNALGDLHVGIGFAGKPATWNSALPVSYTHLTLPTNDQV